MTALECIALADSLDRVLAVREHPDYPNALNGLQFANRGPIRKIGASVDLSLRSIGIAEANGVNFLIVHHGLFWGGLQRIVGVMYDRVSALVGADMAVYSAHLPLDSNRELGNSVLLARRLGLQSLTGFARYADVHVGVAGEANVATSDLLELINRFASEHQTVVRSTPISAGQRTRRWAICTGSGASSDTLREAHGMGIDTLIVGEGPHHTAVEAQELEVTVIYAGHYATETLGVQALAEWLATEHGLPWLFVPASTGL